jgi:cytochrome P450
VSQYYDGQERDRQGVDWAGSRRSVDGRRTQLGAGAIVPAGRLRDEGGQRWQSDDAHDAPVIAWSRKGLTSRDRGHIIETIRLTFPDERGLSLFGGDHQGGITVTIDSRSDGRTTCPFDHHSAEYAKAYRDVHRDIREAAPVVWSESHGGFWVATDFDSMRSVLTDSENFTIEFVDDNTDGGPLLPATPEMGALGSAPGMFFFSDGERHDAPRAALARPYSKRRVAGMGDAISAQVNRVLDDVLPLGEFDIVDDLAMPVVARVVAEHLGFDVEDAAPIFRAFPSAASLGHEASKPTMSLPEAVTYIGEIVKARRAEPQDDVISTLLQADGGRFSDDDVAGMCMQIIFGSLENPQALAAHCLIFLADREDLRTLLRAQPEKIPAFVTESLRHFNVAMGVARTAQQDTELGGAQIRRGDRIFLPLPGANHDPAQFDHPDEFDIDRDASRHLGLGGGAHVCLGQFLNHAMICEIVSAVLQRVESFSIDADKVIRNTEKSANDNFVKAPMRVDSLRVAS